MRKKEAFPLGSQVETVRPNFTLDVVLMMLAPKCDIQTSAQ